jgi:hypothetical protein
MSFERRIASLQIRLASLKSNLSGVGKMHYCQLPNGSRLGVMALQGAGQLRLGFQYGNGAYSHQDTVSNLRDCLKDMKRDGALASLGKEYRGPMCSFLLPNGQQFGMYVICGRMGDCRLGFQCGNGSYSHLGTLEDMRAIIDDGILDH